VCLNFWPKIGKKLGLRNYDLGLLISDISLMILECFVACLVFGFRSTSFFCIKTIFGRIFDVFVTLGRVKGLGCCLDYVV